MDNTLLFIVIAIGAILIATIYKNIYVAIMKKKILGKKVVDIQSPKTEIPNDKMLIVYNRKYHELIDLFEKISEQYNWENQLKIKPYAKIYNYKNNVIVFTFPYDVNFAVFCNLIFELTFPAKDVKHLNEVFGWTTAKSSYGWLNKSFENKKIMIFIDEKDTELNGVDLVTNANETYKIDIMENEKLIKLKDKFLDYKHPDPEIADLKKYESRLVY